MRRGRLEKAAALARRIGLAIARFNSIQLGDGRRDSRKLWRRVAQLTGKSREQLPDSDINADALNAHYAALSTDPAYAEPKPKLSCPSSFDRDWPSALLVFRHLDSLRRTSAGPDGLPLLASQAWCPLHSRTFLTFSPIPSKLRCSFAV